MAFSPWNFDTLVRNQVAGIQARSAQLIDFSVGSVLRAIVEANAALGLFLQGLVYQVLTLTRASTSTGTDLDSWMADYGLARLPASTAAGQVTFSRFSAGSAELIPAGATVMTFDGSQSFAVTADPTSTAYLPGSGGYQMAAGALSLTVPVAAVTAGAAGNVQAGTVTLITQSIPYVNAVANAASFIGGFDAESDAALRARFRLYIASLSEATRVAVAYAIASYAQGLQYQIVENQDYGTGASDPGQFYIVVDDGSGAPPGSLITTVAGLIEPIRPLGIRYGVFAPTLLPANVSLTLATAPGYSHAAVVTNVAAAVASFVNGLGLGAGLPWSRLEQVAYDASPGVADVTSLLLNGGTSDIPASPVVTIKPATLTVS